MRFLGLTLLTFYSFQAFGLSCVESPLRNLSDAGGSLENLRTTDQNGLGICHIEQLHKMLKAKLPGHPDLSRVQLAIAEKRVRDKNVENKKAVRWMNGPFEIGGSYIDAGNSCEAMKLIKNQDICLAENDRFEQITKLKPAYQGQIISKLSIYFDQRAKGTTESMVAQLKAHPLEADQAIKSCPIEQAFFNTMVTKFVAFKADQDAQYRLPENFVRENLSINSAQLFSGIDYLTHISDVLPGIEFVENGDLATALLDQLVKTEKCVAESLANIAPLCEAFQFADSEILKLTNFGMNLNEIANILQGDLDRDKFFEESFQCPSDKKIHIPKIACETVNTAKIAKHSETEDEYHTKVDEKIEEQLAKQVPVGISTCTRFFKNPEARSMPIGTEKFNCGDTTLPEYKKGEGSHAVTIIGSRCVNGAKQYLIQNSWGSGCFYDASFECTKKGGFWAPASSVINNVRNLNYLE